MINKLKSNAHGISVFSVIFYTAVLFLTLDAYCKNQVTTETPLLNIAGLPFLRMDCVFIIFTAAFLIGATMVRLLKKAAKFLLPFSLGIAGLLSLFIALFDVNTMQLFVPTMRISHVIMTVSRVLAIIAGVSGGFIGAACTILCRQKTSIKTIALSGCTVVILSILAIAENLYNELLIICSVLLLVSSLLCNFLNEAKCKTQKEAICTVKGTYAFFATTCFTALIGTFYSVLCENAGFSQLGWAALSGIAFTIFALVFSLYYHSLLQPAAMLTGSILSYLLIHYASTVVTYSGNRVIYRMPYYISIILFACAVIFSFLLKKQKQTSV